MTATFEFTPKDKVGCGRLADTRWTLCLGAGINGNLTPDWEELARRLTNKSSGLTLDKSEFHKLYERSRWSLDAWIQQALNQYLCQGKTVGDFVAALRSEIYSNIDAAQKSDGLGTSVTDVIGGFEYVPQKNFVKVITFLGKHFKDTTAYRLAELFVDPLQTTQMPESIITFNVDTIFETIYRILQKIQHNGGTTGPWQDPPQTFCRHVRPSQILTGKIPLFHLHGCLPPDTSTRKPRKKENDNLVFQESSYTGLAGKVFSWPQNIFLHAAQYNTMCFIGMSMSDPNIRRWLSWASSAYASDLEASHGVPPSQLSGRHVWVESRQGLSADAMRLYRSCPPEWCSSTGRGMTSQGAVGDRRRHPPACLRMQAVIVDLR